MQHNAIHIVCPAKSGSRYGNRITADRWQKLLRQLGYSVRIVNHGEGPCDVLIALHANRSAAEIQRSRQLAPRRPVIVAVTGTDLYRDGNSSPTQSSLQTADRIVVLQETALLDLTEHQRRKAHVIYQSCAPLQLEKPQRPRSLRVVVAGHLRQLKDPFRAAMAVRKLPRESRIAVHHYGGVIEPKLQLRAKAESRANPRYRYHGEVKRFQLRRIMAQSWLVVLSSQMEGGANVLSEAIVNETPILASRIAGSIGILGEDYPGFFPVGDTGELRRLLLQCERDETFYAKLRSGIRQRAPLFSPNREREAWKDLIRGLTTTA